MKLSSLIIASSDPSEIQVLRQAIEAIDSLEMDQKILSLILSSNYLFDESTFDTHRDAGWNVIHSKNNNFTTAFLLGLGQVDGDLLLYNDSNDIIQEIPNKKNLNKLFASRYIKCLYFNSCLECIDASQINDMNKYFKLENGLCFIDKQIDLNKMISPAVISVRILKLIVKMLSDAFDRNELRSVWSKFCFKFQLNTALCLKRNLFDYIPLTIDDIYRNLMIQSIQ